jgi:serine/threonine protein kinase
MMRALRSLALLVDQEDDDLWLLEEALLTWLTLFMSVSTCIQFVKRLQPHQQTGTTMSSSRSTRAQTHISLPTIPSTPLDGNSSTDPLHQHEDDDDEVLVMDPLPVNVIRSASMPPSPPRVKTPQITNRKQYTKARNDLTAKLRVQKENMDDEEKQRSRYFVLGEEFVLDERYSLLKRLGEGSYGVVCSATDAKRHGQKVAIKKVIDVFTEHSRAKKVLREIKLLTFLKHPCIMRTLDILNPLSKSDFDNIYIITEYASTDLHKILQKERQILDESKDSKSGSPILFKEQIAWITFQLLCVLKYLKSARVIHRDLKPDNILVNPDCSIRVCDFGLARGIKHDSDSGDVDFAQDMLTVYVVTRWYRAPEVLCSAGKYSHSIDLWAVGCILAEMFSKIPLFPGKDSFEQLKVIFSTIGCPSEDELDSITYPPAAKYVKQHILPKNTSNAAASMEDSLKARIPGVDADALDLLCKILVFDPRKRISVDDALKHKFFEEIYDSELLSKSVCPEAYSFEYENMTRTIDNIRSLMFEEIIKFRPFALENNPLEEDGPKHKRMLDFQKSC